MSQRVRFGMLGTGNFSPFLAQYINEVAEVVAICDPIRKPGPVSWK